MDSKDKPQEKVAGVTGATSGIGQATVAKLVQAGMCAIANGRRKEKLEALETMTLGSVPKVSREVRNISWTNSGSRISPGTDLTRVRIPLSCELEWPQPGHIRKIRRQ
jgi:NAD(P)-dependent dehydrogenase (short-subunit alcohol dehydrogenase family)